MFWVQRVKSAEVYVLLWLSCGLPATLLLAALGGLPDGGAVAVILLAAALWELTPMKRRALNRCHRGEALPPTGAGGRRSLWLA